MRAYPEHSPMGRAVGGAVGSGTPYVVGERGPELFVPSSSGIIIPDLGTGQSGEKLDANTRELKRLNDNLFAMLNPDTLQYGGGGGGDGSRSSGGDYSSSSGDSGGRTSEGRGGGPFPTTNPPADMPKSPGGLSVPPSGNLPNPAGPSGLDPFTMGATANTARSQRGESTFAPMPVHPPGAGGGGADDDLPTNVLAFTRGIGKTESGFSRKEAYSERLNKASNNANVRKYGEIGGDYGYYQMNGRDVQEGIQLGMSPDEARHLHGGGKGGNSTLDEQTRAVGHYLQLKYPNETKSLVENNNFEGMRSKVQGKWFGVNSGFSKSGKPLGHPELAKAEFAQTRDAARVSAAAVAGGGIQPGDSARARSVIDSGGGGGPQKIEGSGHVQVQVSGHGMVGPSERDVLFKPVPEQQKVQMQPATVGPSEKSRAGPPTMSGSP